MAMKKPTKKVASKKKVSESGRDNRLQTKADAAEKKVKRRNQMRSNYYNRTPAQKKASQGVRSDLAGVGGVGNSVLPSGKSGFVGNYSGRIGRTAQRDRDQAKRANARRAERTAKKVKRKER